jgi:hypothetical protein
MRLLLVVAAALLLAYPAAARQSTTPEPSRSEAFTAALALLEDMDLEQQMMAGALQSTEAAMGVQIEALQKRGVELPATLTERLRVLVLEEAKTMVELMSPTIRTEAATIYANFFSAEELRELKRLQSNPVAQKATKLAPLLMAELAKIGMRVSAERGPQLEAKIADMVAQWIAEREVQTGPDT